MDKFNSILDKANDIVYGDREATYGDPSKNLRNIAAYWSIHLSAVSGQKITLTMYDVCVMMILMKQARLSNQPTHMDSIIDTAGYAAVLERCISSEKEAMAAKGFVEDVDERLIQATKAAN